MRPAREILNKLHILLSVENYNEIYIHQCSQDVIMVIRQNPINCSSYVLITRTGFWDDPNSVSQTGLKLPGVVSKLVFLSVLSFKNKPFVEDPNYIKGLKGNLEILTNLQEFGTLIFLIYIKSLKLLSAFLKLNYLIKLIFHN